MHFYSDCGGKAEGRGNSHIAIQNENASKNKATNRIRDAFQGGKTMQGVLE